ncbi:hypothetical protein ABZ436_07035 [Micromonospora matsumotoense]|uniref:hypothetical protein n=1 Tax=Micromonospora matsumotoense TaxID=121616 RepID=UPI0033E73C93
MVTSRLPESTGDALAVAAGLPADLDGAAVGGDVAGPADVAVPLGVTAPEGVPVLDGVLLPDAAPVGVAVVSPQAINVPEQTSSATPVTHFAFNIPCSSTRPREWSRGSST